MEIDKFLYNESDLAKARQLFFRSRNRLLRTFAVIMVVLVFLWLISGDINFLCGFFFSYLLILALFYYVGIPIFTKRYFNKYPLLHKHSSFSLREEGIEVISENSRSFIKWGEFIRWQSDSFCVISYISPRQFIIFPTRMSKDGLFIEYLKKQLHQYVGNPS